MTDPRRLGALVLLSLLPACGATGAREDHGAQEPALPEPVGPTLTVMSYNIHYGVGMDEQTDLARIARVISEQSPDIVGLQEIGNAAMAEELGRLTDMPFVFGPSKGSDEGYGDAVLCRLPFRWVGNHSIPSASSSRYQAMAIDVDLPESGREATTVRFVNTHFDWLDTLGSQEARLAAVEVIERGFFEENGLPAILAGDLNAVPASPPLARLADRGWHHEDLGQPMLTWKSTAPEKQIDYLLVRPAERWRVLSVEVLDEPVASDHLPVLMTLELVDR